MKTIRFALLLLGAGMLLTTGQAAETVPTLVNYQGLLVNADNTPLANGNHPVQFRIWDQAQNGNLIWGPQSNVVAVYNGQFNVLLGPTDAAARPLAGAFRGANRFLEIQVSNNLAIAPRQQILSAPYALNARSLDATNWSAVFDNGDPATGKIPGSKIAVGAITSTQIADGSVTMTDLGILNRLSASDGNPTDAVYVNATGNVGVGTTSPSYLLDVHQGSFGVRGYPIAPASDAYYENLPYTLVSSNRIILQGAWQPYAASAYPAIVFDPAYRPDPQGGIEMTSSSRLRVFGTHLMLEKYLYLTNLPTTGSSANLYVDSTGLVRKFTSSKRYKDQIEPWQEDFDRILELQPKQYVRRGGPKEREVGYIAEDLDELGLKALTVYDAEGRPESIDYPRMIIYATEILKEHRTTIRKQQEDLEALRAEMEALKKLVSQSR